MKNIVIGCPHCDEETEIDIDKESAICSVCGKEFEIKDAVAKYVNMLRDFFNEKNHSKFDNTHVIDDDECENGSVCSADKVEGAKSKGILTSDSVSSPIEDFEIEDGVLKKYHGTDSEVIVPKCVTKIVNEAFEDNIYIKTIKIPDSVTSIGENEYFLFGFTSNSKGAFSGCSALERIIVDKNNPVYDSRNDCNAVIESKTNKLVAGCKATIIPNSVKNIGKYAFTDCENLTSITIPSSVTVIGKYAFSNCKNLTSIIIPDSVINIGDDESFPFPGVFVFNNVFLGCSALESITVDKNNPVYDSRNDCNAIIESRTNILITGCKTTIIPDSVKSIGESAFDGCENLISITIPGGVTDIGRRAFSSCSSLERITVDKNNPVYDSRDNCNAIIESKSNKLVVGCKETIIPNSVTHIGRMAFSGCKKLINITIPNSVTNIDDGAFNGCTRLPDITIPNSVTKIGKWAFWNCTSLLIVRIPEKLYVSDAAFMVGKKYRIIRY